MTEPETLNKQHSLVSESPDPAILDVTPLVCQPKITVQEELLPDSSNSVPATTSSHEQQGTEPPSKHINESNSSAPIPTPSPPNTQKGASFAQVVGINGGQTDIMTQLNSELQKAKRDLESMVLKYATSERENLNNQRKAEELDKKLKRAIKDNEQLANRIKIFTNERTHLTDTLNAKVAQLTVLEQKNNLLSDKQGGKLKDYEEQIEKLRVSNEDLLKKIESYKSKEGELLDFSERLSMKHLILQSELDEALKKVPSYKKEYEAALMERDNLIIVGDKLSGQLESMGERLREEQLKSGRLLKEQEAKEIRFRSQVDELENEIKVTRRKHQMATKLLMKEIRQLQEQLAAKAVDSSGSLADTKVGPASDSLQVA